MPRRPSAFIIALGALALLGHQPRTARAMGGQFGMEFAIDAPWRLEPVTTSDGRVVYGAIPIVITFHDTLFEGGRGELASSVLEKINVGRLVGVRVTELAGNQRRVTNVPVSAFTEIEVKRPLSIKSAEPPHELCRPALGQSCPSLLTIADSHEWHGVFWYSPRVAVTPGRNVHLQVTVLTKAKTIYPPPPGPLVAPARVVDVSKEWTNHLVVHAGEAPLPRFGTDWLYGDVHYHAQMTDNEGESGYSYRNVARALGAMGLDFVFATDHASNGEQVDGSVGGHMEARDLNASRFAAAKSIIYGPDGVNQLIGAEAAQLGFPRLKAANVLPQVYLGEEVDAWPEMSSREFADGMVYYGDLALFGGGAKYNWLRQEGFATCNQGPSPGYNACKARYARPYSPGAQTFLLYDDQGIPVSQEIDGVLSGAGSLLNHGGWIPDSVEPHPSRQHIVYFPTSKGLDTAGWIGSDTGRFGGASKRLQQVIQEIEAGGFAFLAHPVEDPEPGSLKGPDVVPYSDVALERAWRSPAILGLQFWNENDRYRAGPAQLDRTVVSEKKTKTAGLVTAVKYTYRWPYPGFSPDSPPWRWQQYGQLNRGIMGSTFAKLHHGAAAWDRFLRKGLDPRQTAALPWLTRGEPRKWFMAGGSDAHGDLNYRRYGRPSTDSRWSDYPVGDTAIGNPRNLVSMTTRVATGAAASEDFVPAPGGPKRYGNRAVIEAFRGGSFAVTDGPAIRIAIDTNGNGRIDDSDPQMGSTFQFYAGEHIPLLVEWLSTPEFGPIEQIDVYVGNRTATFAAKGHGSRFLPFTGGSGQEEYGGYKPDPSGALRINLKTGPAGAKYRGIARVFLGPAQFALAPGEGTLSYVRAFARTIVDISDTGECSDVGGAGNKCGDRFAYSNPIWAKYQAVCPVRRPRPPGTAGTTALGSGTGANFVDSDQNGLPDTCERSLPNPCARTRLHGEVGPDIGSGNRPPVSTDPGRPPATPPPARAIPASSCQKLAAF